MLRYRFVLPFCLLAGACMPDRPVVPRAAIPEQQPAYRVQVGDVLGVRLYLAPELNEDVTVRPDGRITTTLAQSVAAAGRTCDDIAADLRLSYAAELKNPQLAVEIRTASPSRIYVAGEVVSPGEYFETGANLTLLQAVARAGGLRPAGDPSHVFILRHGIGNTPIVLRTDYLAAASGRDAGADVSLAAFDIVYVPKTGIARIYQWFNQHFQQFVPVSWGFSYAVNPYVSPSR
jgi:polysaccharide export outer membrane protein